MDDEELRRLERAAGAGDASALTTLIAALHRLGRAERALAAAGVTFASIPAGDAQVGEARGALLRAPQHRQHGARTVPPRRVSVAGFRIAHEPLTLAQVVALEPFLRPALGEEGWAHATRETDTTRVVELRAPVAEALARALGAALPGWLEWEVAARGTHGRLLPWGDQWDTTALSLRSSWYSVDEESVMGHYAMDQELVLVESFGRHAGEPSPFGLRRLARAGREWNQGSPEGNHAHVLRSLSDLGDMASMVPGIRRGTWDSNDFRSNLARVFSGPSLACWAPPGEPYEEAAVRLMKK